MSSDVALLPREPDILLELRGENGKLRAMLETLRRTLYGARSERNSSWRAALRYNNDAEYMAAADQLTGTLTKPLPRRSHSYTG